MSESPVIHVSAMGNLGNRMIQYMAALSIAARLGEVRFSRVQLPEWGILHAPLPNEAHRTITLLDEALDAGRIDQEAVCGALASHAADAVDVRCYAQNAANFLPAEAYRSVFADPGYAGATPDELLISVRQGDILDAHHQDYVLPPADFYEDLLQRTGLAPVFMGQLDDTPYLATLRRRFPQARFQPSRGALTDFSVLRNSANIVLSVSTFSWLAAYLSRAERIFMPVLGLLHPLQCRSVDLLPANDPRWRFFLFPFHYAVTQEKLEAAHASLRGLWREMPEPRLRALFANAPTAPTRSRDMRLSLFLEDEYLRINDDVADAVRQGTMPSGRHHYEHYGQAEQRATLLIDPAWYCMRYPIAAVELGQGDATDCFQHWLEIGAARGYRRSDNDKR